MTQHTVFFVSDGTGITAETFGNSILAQFPVKARHVRRPIIDSGEKAHQRLRWGLPAAPTPRSASRGYSEEDSPSAAF